MKYALIDSDGIVSQCSCRQNDGFIECPDYVCVGYTYDGISWVSPCTSSERLAYLAQIYAKRELDWVDVQLKYNANGDTARSKFTDEVLYAYAIECRDYVQNIDGVLTIMTDKPDRPS